MNHLAHFKLAGSESQLLAGNLLADFVKGRLHGEYPPGVERGIALHRAIDAFTDRHQITRDSRLRFDGRFRRVGGIMTDIIYDHFLAANWSRYHDQPLENFCNDIFRKLEIHHHLYHGDASNRAARMRQHRSMQGYVEPDFIERSFSYLSGQLKHDNPLDEAYLQFESNRQSLQEDFETFFPLLESYCHEWLCKHPLSEQETQ